MSERKDFKADLPVQLLQACYQGEHAVLAAGEYPLDQIPDIAFTLDIVRQLPKEAASPFDALAASTPPPEQPAGRVHKTPQAQKIID